MYVHAHLRYCEAAATLGDTAGFVEGLLAVNPIAVTERLAHASLRQRNCTYTSSDAAFRDRYEASGAVGPVKAGTVAVDAGCASIPAAPAFTSSSW